MKASGFLNNRKFLLGLGVVLGLSARPALAASGCGAAFSVLVVGGGGGGGYNSGGGGGGADVETGTLTLSASSYTVTVGSGGTGATTTGASGGLGGNSSFASLTATGGGGGASQGGGGGSTSGGSGGGGEWNNTGGASAGTGAHVNAGGKGANTSSNYYTGGGGGGAGTAGASASTVSPSEGGNGGAGYNSATSGTSSYYGGGGGGGGDDQRGDAAGSAGSGGGGAGGYTTAATAGTANTGGGGGGGSNSSVPNSGANGGSGVVIISFPTADGVATATGAYTASTSGSNYIYTFTGNGTFSPPAACSAPTYTYTPTATPTQTATKVGSQTFTLTVSPTTLYTGTRTDTPTPSPTWTTAGGGLPTATPTYTPNLTQTYEASLPTVYSGLPTNMRPYGLEYVPFPTVTTSLDQFSALYMTFTTSGDGTLAGGTLGTLATDGASPTLANTKWGAPCNTARWHIVFQGLSGQAEVETRIGPNGVACGTGVYDPTVYASALSLTLPAYPQNFSSAYFWISPTAVPYTERFDAVGDPRFVPYADVLDYTGAVDDGFQGGYNWFWRDFNDTSSTYFDGAQDAFYQPFIPSAIHDHYLAASEVTAATVAKPDQGQNIDIPKLFQLIREGVMTSNGIYTAMTGWDSYYAAQGGEIGGDTANDFNYGVPCYGGPWGNSSNGWNVDEIIGGYEYGTTDVNVNGAVYVVTGTASTVGWMSLPFLGELWPDGLYETQWKSTNSIYGNLANIENTAQGGTAYRVVQQDLPSASSPYYLETLHHQQEIGCASMLNGTNDGTTPFNHYSVSPVAVNLLNDGTQLAQYNFSVPSTFEVTRPWSLSAGTFTPLEWSDAPYDDRRTHLDVYSTVTYTTVSSASPGGWGFYAYPSPDAASATQKSAAAIRTIDLDNALSPAPNSGKPAGGWFIVNGLAPSTQSGINFVAQFALLSCLRTFHDAGVPTMAASATAPAFTNAYNTYTGAGTASGSTYRIPPVPLVTILHPNSSDPVAGMTTVTIKWDERYARWDGNQDDENYPCLDANVGPCSSSNVVPNPALEWHDPQQLAFNVIYSLATATTGTAGTKWYSVLTGDEVPAGPSNNYVAGAAGNYLSTTADVILPGSSYEYSPYQYSVAWANVAPALYNLEVECFRLPNATSTVAYPHYAYHEIQIDTAP